MTDLNTHYRDFHMNENVLYRNHMLVSRYGYR